MSAVSVARRKASSRGLTPPGVATMPPPKFLSQLCPEGLISTEDGRQVWPGEAGWCLLVEQVEDPGNPLFMQGPGKEVCLIVGEPAPLEGTLAFQVCACISGYRDVGAAGGQVASLVELEEDFLPHSLDLLGPLAALVDPDPSKAVIFGLLGNFVE